MIEILTKAAGIVGLIMVGAMTSQTVVFKTILEFKMKGQSLMNVQSALDSIFIGIVPLLMTFGCYKLLNKKVNVIAIIFGIVALGIVFITIRYLLINTTGGRFEYNEMQSILYAQDQEWNL